MNWTQLVSPNKYGECAMEDIQDLVGLFETYVKRRGAALAIEPGRLVAHILQYVYLRQTSSVYEISGPRTQPVTPVGWTAEEEAIWSDWIAMHCSFESWGAEVLDPIFGTDIRLWEAVCDGWRLELVQFFPWWIQRSFDIVEQHDPAQLEMQEEEGNANVDSYIMDHGSAKQKKAAMRAGV